MKSHMKYLVEFDSLLYAFVGLVFGDPEPLLYSKGEPLVELTDSQVLLHTGTQ